MTDKALVYAMFAEEKAKEISTSQKAWTSFLSTVSRVYKYNYFDQLLIHAQRPNATACAPYEVWNNRMNRYIRRGSKGIGLLDISENRTTVHYVFDISDTGERANSKQFIPWELTAENETAVHLMLSREYGIPADIPLPDQIEMISALLTRDYWNEHQKEIVDKFDGALISSYDSSEVGGAFRRAAAASIAYTLMMRCGEQVDRYFQPEDFRDVFVFNTHTTIAAVGSAVSVCCGQVLRQLERTIKEAERSHDNERTDLHPARRLPVPEPDLGREAGGTGQVREDAQDVPDRASPGPSEPAGTVREAVPAPRGDQSDSRSEAGTPDDAAEGAERRDGGAEGPRPDAVGGHDEQPESAGGGDHPDGAGVQLNQELAEQLNLFEMTVPPEAEQIMSIDQAESAPAPFAFSVHQSDIDQILRVADNTHEHRMIIVAEFSKQKTPEELAPVLARIYHGGYGIEGEHGRVAAWFAEDGIHLSSGRAARHLKTAQVVTWVDAAKRISDMLAEGTFATNVEVAASQAHERRLLASGMWNIARSLSEEAKERGSLASFRYPERKLPAEEEAIIEARLADPEMLSIMIDECRTFREAYLDDRTLMNYRLRNTMDSLRGVIELALPRVEFDSGMIEIPACGHFITDDEINAFLGDGSNIYESKIRIFDFFSQPHTEKEKIDFLKHEYGIGGRAPAVSGALHSDEWHDSKGIRLKKQPCEDVLIKWNKVVQRIDDMIRKGRYLTPEQQAEIEALRSMHEEPENIMEESVVAEETAPDDEAISLPDKLEEAAPSALEPAVRTTDYQLLDRLRSDCEYFLGAGQRNEGQLWAGSVHGQIAKMRELYESLPDKPEWLTEAQIDSYADRMAPPYLVVAYHHFEGGFDAKMDYQTIDAAEKAAKGYISGTMEMDGFRYDGAAVYDQSEKRYLRVYGDFPDARAMAQAAAAEQPHTESAAATLDTPTPVTETPYHVGDTIYLDNMPFVIESIGKFDVHMRDPNATFPIMRAESRESLAYLLTLDQRNAAFFSSELPAEADEHPADIDAPAPQTPSPEHTLTVDAVPERAIIPENYHITDEHLGEGGPKAKFRGNVEAIRVLKGLEASGRPASSAEQEILARYVGWGGLADAFDASKPAWTSECAELKNLLTRSEYEAARASTLNAHYTSPTVIRAIYETIERMGFTTGNILEPAMGVGNFFGMLPASMESSHLYGVELDSITGRIAQKLYPHADITVAGFETTDRRDFFDIAIGNVPFGNYQVNDPAYNKLGFAIHNYFIAKAIDQVRPGGVIAFVTSRYTMDKQSPDVRKYIAQRAELLGAVRLPNNAFKANAGTDVVTDILFLQKRDRAIEVTPDWVHLGTNPDGHAINSYFIDHPEMILGNQTSVSTQYGKQDFTVTPIEGANLAVQLAHAMQNITGHYEAAELPDLGEGESIRKTIPADPDVRNYSFTLVGDDIYYREGSIMAQPDLNQTAMERIRGMIGLRDCVRELIDLQMTDGTDEEISLKQGELNRLYDAFAAKHGLINTRANALAFSSDSSYYLLCSLEVINEQGIMTRKADMFTKRTIQRAQVVDHVDTASEALAVSIAERARVDLPYMAQLSGKSESELAEELTGVIFRVPFSMDEYVTADEYLSGNVRQKLREAIAAAGSDASFAPNVTALQAAQPKDLDASEIDVRLGATWVDKSYIQQFMWETFSTPLYLQRGIHVNFSPHTAEWNISGKTSISANNVAAYVTYGTSRANAYHILEDTLNLRDVRVYDIVEDENGKEKRVLNQKETTLAQQKQQAIRDAFREWVWEDPTRRQDLVQTYNERFNSIRPREYNGEHITFGGMTPDINLREHQRNAVAHILYGGNTLLAHVVGAGKTYEMIAAAMESKRLGLCRKSMIVVPNHLTEQWASEFLRLYPAANILVTTKKDFEKAHRKKFCARIATGDYDAVIIGHSQFEKIPISQERQERLIQDQIDEITDGIMELQHNYGERFTIKQLEKTRRQLEVRLQKLKADRKKDDVVTFEELGVDRLYVDESHSFKNLYLYTKMRNVAGLSTTEAQKSSDMFAKCRYLDEITGSRGVIFATGTPVSNSMTEMYTIQRYLQYESLRQNNMTHFDAWASTFGETTTAIELAPEGTGYRARTRFAKFFNLPELMTMFKQVADVKTADQLNLPTPTPHFETVVVKPTAEQQRIVESLSERAAKVHAGSVDPHVDNMLKITSDGRKLGLDQRLINPLLPDDPGSKVNTCVANIYRIWDEGQEQRLTQLVFCDLSTPKSAGSEHTGEFSVYDDIRAKLIARGVPPEQIAFIHDANTEIKKKELFARVRSGDVRVLIGSTAKMGAGTNCQDRLIAIHDCDCPWRPGDLEQRSGRIIRQGNMNPDVHIYRYVTEGTFDSYLWQTIECKQRFISQIMTSKSPVRACDDVDEAVLSYAEIKALCAGDPRIKEKMDLDVDVARLRLMKADHKSKQYKLEDQLLRYFPAALKTQQGYEEGFLHDLDTLAAHPVPEKDFVGIEIRGVSYTDKEAAGKALIACMKDAAKGDAIPVGHYRGLELQMFYDTFGKEFKLTMQGAMTHTVTLGSDPKGNLLRMENGLATIPARLEVVRSEIDNLHRQQEAAQTEVKKPFPQEEELKVKSSRLTELDAALNIGNTAASSEPAEDRIAKQTRPACLPSNPHHRSVQTKKTRQEVR